MDENREALGRAVKEARTRRGMTQNQLSDAAGVSRATLQNLERGGHIRQLNLAKIETLLGWAQGSGQAILDGASGPIEAVPLGSGTAITSIPEGDLLQAIVGAMVAVADTMTASEIREVARAAVEELRRRGLV
ncbi:helix-turn-helix transcriptional regulator [Streptomyces sp. NPDC059569]|uniref:helix-turn-helix transcriptional regulator n=1 Tax=Streptomyces sp. NPDC059569 TaxID=3346869 RepID=UPI0036CEA577